MLYYIKKDTLEVRSLSKLYYLGGVAVLYLLFILSTSSTEVQSVRTISQEEKLVILKELDNFSNKALKEEIGTLNFKFPHIVYAQAVLESGRFKSKIFLENNNLFGMKVASSRATLGKGEQSGYAYYDSWKESLYDYALYYNRYLSSITSEKGVPTIPNPTLRE